MATPSMQLRCCKRSWGVWWTTKTRFHTNSIQLLNILFYIVKLCMWQLSPLQTVICLAFILWKDGITINKSISSHRIEKCKVAIEIINTSTLLNELGWHSNGDIKLKSCEIKCYTFLNTYLFKTYLQCFLMFCKNWTSKSKFYETKLICF